MAEPVTLIGPLFTLLKSSLTWLWNVLRPNRPKLGVMKQYSNSPDGGMFFSSITLENQGSFPVWITGVFARGSKPEPPKIPSADQRGLSRARSMG